MQNRDDAALFAGLIVTGSDTKRVIFRAISASLKSVPESQRLNDPTLELLDNKGVRVAFNDNWKDSPDRDEIAASGFAPDDDRDSVLIASLNSGTSYTVIVRGKNNATGIALVELYDRNPAGNSQLANLSSRGFVERGDNALFGGLIVGSEDGGTRVVVRGIGTSLSVPNRLEDPTIELFNGNGDSLGTNDNWKDSSDRAEIESTGLAPKNDAEAALILNVQPADYTAIVRGKDGGVGVGVVEIYNVPRAGAGQ